MSEQTTVPLPDWCARLGVFDLETTGIDVAHDRIVTAHVGVIDGDGQIVEATGWLADPGIEIPERAERVHGVSTASARAHGREASLVVAEVSDALSRVFSRGIPVVAYNAPFDFTVLRNERRRYGIPEPEMPSLVIDPLVLDKAFDRYRRGKRTLSDVAAHYAVTLDSAHEAAADAVAAGRVALEVLRRFASALPPSAADLHRQQVAWAHEQAESLSAYFTKIGRTDAAVDGRWPLR